MIFIKEVIIFICFFTKLYKCNFCYNSKNYNYLILNLQWPTTFVEHNFARKGNHYALKTHRSKYGLIFTVHGLWPQKTIGYGPTNCNHTDPFDLGQVSKIDNIEKYWTSFGLCFQIKKI